MASGPPLPLVVLRAPHDGDVAWITRACQDPDIQRWTRVPVPYGTDDARVFVADGAGSLAVWAVVDGDSGDGLAMVAIHGIDAGDAALGYWVAPWARRRKVATAAVEQLVAHCETLDGVVQASLDIAVANPASQGVARRAGFVPGSGPEGLTVPDGDGESPAVRHVRRLA